MNASPENSNSNAAAIRPPQLIQSLVGGFNAVANNIFLILLPVVLDLLLWFGPHLRIKALFEPDILQVFNYMRQNGSLDMRPMLDSLELVWKTFLGQYNLMTMLSTFPVGVPSHMVATLPMHTPLGAARLVELGSFGQFLLGWLLLTLAGFLLGSVYFAYVARTCGDIQARQGLDVECMSNLPGEQPLEMHKNWVPEFRPGILMWETFQVVLMSIVLVLIVLAMMIPSLLLSALLALASPIIAQFALLVIGFAVIWFLIPLVFTPHGIFLCGQSVFTAMASSARVVRHSLPGTGLFLLAVIVLNQGLGLLWSSPPDSSWLSLISVFGHAFISTGLLAASFFYYRGGLNYIQSLRRIAAKSI